MKQIACAHWAALGTNLPDLQPVGNQQPTLTTPTEFFTGLRLAFNKSDFRFR
jgi:hypothetical protein